MAIRHKAIGFLVSAAAAALLCAPALAADPLSRYSFYFDTLITVTLYDHQSEEILDECSKKMAEYENMLSRTREGSEIWQINHSNGQPVEVSDETLELIQKALYYCEISDGALDITIAPVVDLWDFHEDSDKLIPDKETVEEALSHVDYRGVIIDGNTVTLKDPKAEIDLGCIAKGFISDRIRDFLAEKGVTSAMINLGGNVRTLGTKPDGSPWRVGIQKPFAAAAMEMADIVLLEDQAVITSGTYERYFIVDDVLYHHILDPKTGFPVINELDSVSILSENGDDGDALSTTCFLLGTEKGLELIESLDGIEALFIDHDGNKTASSGWKSAE